MDLSQYEDKDQKKESIKKTPYAAPKKKKKSGKTSLYIPGSVKAEVDKWCLDNTISLSRLVSVFLHDFVIRDETRYFSIPENEDAVIKEIRRMTTASYSLVKEDE